MGSVATGCNLPYSVLVEPAEGAADLERGGTHTLVALQMQGAPADWPTILVLLPIQLMHADGA
eukprot:11206350-Lingulodinium_polyedra.AAC.1